MTGLVDNTSTACLHLSLARVTIDCKLECSESCVDVTVIGKSYGSAVSVVEIDCAITECPNPRPIASEHTSRPTLSYDLSIYLVHTIEWVARSD
ncbi:unnamed protein product [Oppiella nova]|uniref:Uncharacterized protein n=1 Tax=Oppiella nova TaxID=334625 RepID=A0A7R9QXH3_9ACAR|nr:unnamed protein product [Oppiella nova]CAG2178028.1 unnamed protein product [Oppiella nova]